MKIILGSAQFGLDYGINNNVGKPSDVDLKSILDRAQTEGIRLLDTAENYGDAQRRIGDYHKKCGKKFEVITKFSSSLEIMPTSFRERIVNDIKILDIDSLYGYLFHSFDDFNSYFRRFESELLQLKCDGLIKRLGVSLYTNDELERVLEFDNVDLIQIPYNLLDNASKRNEVLIKAKRKAIEIHTRSPFLQGLLFKSSSELKGDLVQARPYLVEIDRISRQNNISIGELAISYCMANANIDNVVLGVDSVRQVTEISKWAKESLTKRMTDMIDQVNVKEESLLNPSTWIQKY